MIKRFLLMLLLVFSSAAVYAGSYENALKKNDNVFLYMYIDDCRTCKVFDSVYNNIKNQNKDYEYVKVNADTLYGSQLMYKFRGRYVPYVILTNAKSKKSVNVSHSCVMDEICLIRAMKSFKG